MAPPRRSGRTVKGKGKATEEDSKSRSSDQKSPTKPPSQPEKGASLTDDTAASHESVKTTASSAVPSVVTATSGASSPTFTSFTISTATKGSKPIPCIRSHPDSSASPPLLLIFTHGAGGDLSAPATVHFTHGFASTDSAVVSFQGSMNLKGRAGMFNAVKEFEAQKGTRRENLPAFGGRSMGARAAVIASHTDPDVKMLILSSYPLIGPGGDVRDQILLDVRPGVDVLFVSGDGDNMCSLGMLNEVRRKMKAKSWLVTVKGADHGMNLRGGKKLKIGTEMVGREAGRVARRWLRERQAEEREMSLKWDGEREKVLGTWGDDDHVVKEEGEGKAEKDGIKRYFSKADQKDEAVPGEEVTEPAPKRKRTKK